MLQFRILECFILSIVVLLIRTTEMADLVVTADVDMADVVVTTLEIMIIILTIGDAGVVTTILEINPIGNRTEDE